MDRCCCLDDFFGWGFSYGCFFGGRLHWCSFGRRLFGRRFFDRGCGTRIGASISASVGFGCRGFGFARNVGFNGFRFFALRGSVGAFFDQGGSSKDRSTFVDHIIDECGLNSEEAEGEPSQDSDADDRDGPNGTFVVLHCLHYFHANETESS